jgi:hypothetical protein
MSHTVFEHLVIGTQLSQPWTSSNEPIACDAHRADNARLDPTKLTPVYLADTHTLSSEKKTSLNTRTICKERLTWHEPPNNSWRMQVCQLHDIHEGHRLLDLSPCHFARSSCCRRDVCGHWGQRILVFCRRSARCLRLRTDDHRRVRGRRCLTSQRSTIACCCTGGVFIRLCDQWTTFLIKDAI